MVLGPSSHNGALFFLVALGSTITVLMCFDGSPSAQREEKHFFPLGISETSDHGFSASDWTSAGGSSLEFLGHW